MPKTSKRITPRDLEIGSRIRLRRSSIKMSQETLGKALGLTFQQVQKYEKGVNRIGGGRLEEISKILGVPVSYFYDDVKSVDGVNNALQFLNSPGVIKLAQAYNNIQEHKVRLALLALAQTLAIEPPPTTTGRRK